MPGSERIMNANSSGRAPWITFAAALLTTGWVGVAMAVGNVVLAVVAVCALAAAALSASVTRGRD